MVFPCVLHAICIPKPRLCYKFLLRGDDVHFNEFMTGQKEEECRREKSLRFTNLNTEPRFQWEEDFPYSWVYAARFVSRHSQWLTIHYGDKSTSRHPVSVFFGKIAPPHHA